MGFLIILAFAVGWWLRGFWRCPICKHHEQTIAEWKERCETEQVTARNWKRACEGQTESISVWKDTVVTLERRLKEESFNNWMIQAVVGSVPRAVKVVEKCPTCEGLTGVCLSFEDWELVANDHARLKALTGESKKADGDANG